MVRENFRIEELLSTSNMRLPQKRALQDDLNDTPQPLWVEPCQNLYWELGFALIVLIPTKLDDTGEMTGSGSWFGP